MPAYVVEFTTESGPHRQTFILDQDRPLREQLAHVLEELHQDQGVLVGGPDDTIGAYWQGRELLPGRSPAQLAISPARPIQLRVRDRQPAPTPAAAAMPARSTSAARFTVAILGAAGAWLAWIGTFALADRSAWFSTVAALEVASAALLGAGVGGTVLTVLARHRGAAALWGAALGVSLGAASAGTVAYAGSWLVTASWTPVAGTGWLVLVLQWTAVGSALAVALSLASSGRAPAPWFHAACLGLGGAFIGALFRTLPGPADAWQLLAFLSTGLAAGLAATADDRTSANAVGLRFRRNDERRTP